MTTSHTGVNGGSFANSITGPAATEFVTGASVGLVAQGAANQDKYIRDAITMVAYTDVRHGFNGRKRMRRARGAALADSNHTLDVSEGDRFELSATPALVRTITLDKVGVVPEEGECIELLVPGAMATGQQYLIKRNSGTTIAEFYGNAAGDAGAWAEFEYVGGDWRLGANCSGGSAGGVMPGAGA